MRPYLLKEAQEKLNIARAQNNQLQRVNDEQLKGKGAWLLGVMIAAGLGYALPLHIAIKCVIWTVLAGHVTGVARLLIRAWRMHALSRKIEKLQTEINNNQNQ
jgi:hypothetical protein